MYVYRVVAGVDLYFVIDLKTFRMSKNSSVELLKIQFDDTM